MGHLQLGIQFPVRVICFPSEIPLEKYIFQLQVIIN